MNGETVKKMI